MKSQLNFLDDAYLSERIRQVISKRSDDLCFEIRKSNRVGSNSLYVHIFVTDSTRARKCCRRILRVSDHLVANAPDYEVHFIVEDKPITRRANERFEKTVNNVVRACWLSYARFSARKCFAGI